MPVRVHRSVVQGRESSERAFSCPAIVGVCPPCSSSDSKAGRRAQGRRRPGRAAGAGEFYSNSFRKEFESDSAAVTGISADGPRSAAYGGRALGANNQPPRHPAPAGALCRRPALVPAGARAACRRAQAARVAAVRKRVGRRRTIFQSRYGPSSADFSWAPWGAAKHGQPEPRVFANARIRSASFPGRSSDPYARGGLFYRIR
jgi:hypothetical protein